MIRSKKKDSDKYKLLRRINDGLPAYKERIKQISAALKLQRGECGLIKENWIIKNERSPRSKSEIVNSKMVKYVHYNTDYLFKKLELLCGERDISNDSVGVRNGQ